jgi:hypothetical protein
MTARQYRALVEAFLPGPTQSDATRTVEAVGDSRLAEPDPRLVMYHSPNAHPNLITQAPGLLEEPTWHHPPRGS